MEIKPGDCVQACYGGQKMVVVQVWAEDEKEAITLQQGIAVKLAGKALCAWQVEGGHVAQYPFPLAGLKKAK